jgi:hypothetical protein
LLAAFTFVSPNLPDDAFALACAREPLGTMRKVKLDAQLWAFTARKADNYWATPPSDISSQHA